MWGPGIYTPMWGPRTHLCGDLTHTYVGTSHTPTWGPITHIYVKVTVPVTYLVFHSCWQINTNTAHRYRHRGIDIHALTAFPKCQQSPGSSTRIQLGMITDHSAPSIDFMYECVFSVNYRPLEATGGGGVAGMIGRLSCCNRLYIHRS
jgi:hypothetical protein